MLGWFSEEIARASRSKRCFASGLSERCAGRTLIATVRSRRVSHPRYTSPIPPAPTGETTSYGPSFVPGMRVMRARHYSVRPVCGGYYDSGCMVGNPYLGITSGLLVIHSIVTAEIYRVLPKRSWAWNPAWATLSQYLVNERDRDRPFADSRGD